MANEGGAAAATRLVLERHIAADGPQADEAKKILVDLDAYSHLLWIAAIARHSMKSETARTLCRNLEMQMMMDLHNIQNAFKL